MIDFAAHTARIINRLGQPITLTPAGGPARQVNAVFRSTPELALGVEAYAPTLRITAADGVGIQVGDHVDVSGKDYAVYRIKDDSADSGDLLLQLEAQ